MSPVMSYDPLPPTNSIAGYSRPERSMTTAEQGNPMSEFFRSLWPSYPINNGINNWQDNEDDGGQQHVAGAEGGNQGDNLTRGVEHLMAAMRELLNTMTYRGDDGGRDGDDDHEWVDEDNND